MTYTAEELRGMADQLKPRTAVSTEALRNMLRYAAELAERQEKALKILPAEDGSCCECMGKVAAILRGEQ